MKRTIVLLLVCLCICFWAGLASPGGESVPAYVPAAYELHTVVVDAGHGGEDGGAVSAAGDRESGINLAIALRCDQLLGLCGVPAVLTRADDRSIHSPEARTLREKKVSDLHNRVSLVEGQRGAMLLSIHQNSYPEARYHGAQVFYGRGEESRLWGELTQRTLLALDGENRRAAKPISEGVYLMAHVNCPAILVECGFLSNPEEAARLLTPEYQTKAAAALVSACMQQLWAMG